MYVYTKFMYDISWDVKKNYKKADTFWYSEARQWKTKASIPGDYKDSMTEFKARNVANIISPRHIFPWCGLP